jgi:hypothetical protein
MATTDFNAWEEQFALAEFLATEGRADEATAWMVKSKTSVERFGPDSPVLTWIDTRFARATAAARDGGPH